MKETEEMLIEWIIENRDIDGEVLRQCLKAKLAVLIYNTKMATIDKLEELQTPTWR